MKAHGLTRRTYKAIKRMDHGQMNEFCERMYSKGYEEGKKDAEGLTVDEMRSVILRIKGIGEKRAADIVTALSLAMEDKGKKEEKR